MRGRARAADASPGGGATSPTYRPGDPLAQPKRSTVGKTRNPVKAEEARGGRAINPLDAPGRARGPKNIKKLNEGKARVKAPASDGGDE